MGGIFADWQPKYAERGIATFPVRDKRPAVRRYLQMGLGASSQLAIKFPQEDSFGFACRPSRITVVDVDAPDERLLADALSEFGPTPFIVRSGSGNFQAWYRHGGERRRIRPDPKRPIDVLGDGFVVAPPSDAPRGQYAIIEGCLDDLDRLPPIRWPSHQPQADAAPKRGRVESGRRNQSLWRECMQRARQCQNVSELMGIAVQLNREMFYEPLPDEEVLRVVASAWAKECSGENWFGRGDRVIVEASEIDDLLDRDPDAFILLAILKRHHWGRDFMIANAMAEGMPGGGWRRQRLAAARNRLEEMDAIELLRPASRQHGPALYRFKVAKNAHQ